MNRRSFLGGALAISAGGSASLVGLFSHVNETAPVQLASAQPVAVCRATISTATSDSTAELVNVVRAYLRDAGLLQDFQDAAHLHAYMTRVYTEVLSFDEETSTEELSEAQEYIVNFASCDPGSEPDAEMCADTEARKIAAHVDALKIYPVDSSIAFEALEPIDQYKVSEATVAFTNLVLGFYPSMVQEVWPDGAIDPALNALNTRIGEQEMTLAGAGICYKPMPGPVNIAPAPPTPEPVRQRSTPGLVLRA